MEIKSGLGEQAWHSFSLAKKQMPHELTALLLRRDSQSSGAESTATDALALSFLVFGNLEETISWLRTAQSMFESKTPLQLLHDGRASQEKLTRHLIRLIEGYVF